MDKTQTITVFAILSQIRECAKEQDWDGIERLVHAAESVLCGLPIEARKDI